MATSDAQLVTLARSHQGAQAVLAARTAEQVGTLWDRLGGLDDAALERFSTSAATTVRAAQITAAGVAAGYVRSYVSLADGAPLELGDVNFDELAAGARGGVAPETVYARPIITARAAIAEGKTFAVAMAAGRVRATSAAETDVALARRSGTFDAMGRARDRVVGYRRVPSSSACLFCKVASTQRYKLRDLLPLHSHCHCTVAPIVGQRDPGRIINRDVYTELKAAGVMDDITAARQPNAKLDAAKNARDRADYWRNELAAERDPARIGRIEERIADWQAKAKQYEREAAATKRAAYAVEQHGELGPVLVHAGDRFTGPKDLAA